MLFFKNFSLRGHELHDEFNEGKDNGVENSAPVENDEPKKDILLLINWIFF